MKALVAVLLLFVQSGRAPAKWECREGAEPLPHEQLKRVKSAELKERVVSCSLPRLPPTYDAQGTVIVELQVDETGCVRCAGPLAGGSEVMRGAAVKAAMKWRFEPLLVDGKAQPFRSFLSLLVHWYTPEMEKQCPEEKRRA